MHRVSKTKLTGIAATAAVLMVLLLRLVFAPPSHTIVSDGGSASYAAVEHTTEESSPQQTAGFKKTESSLSGIGTQEKRHVASDIAQSMIACYQLLGFKRETESWLATPTDGMDSEQLLGRASRLEKLGEQLKKREHACDTTNADGVSKDLYPSLLLAARLGDTDAASCYASAGFAQNADELQPEKTAEFQKNALAFIDAGMKRGDWRFAEIASTASSRYSVRDHYANVRAWNRHLLPADKVAAYGYQRLLRYGMSGEFAEQADKSLAAQREGLDPDKVDAVEKWARDQYMKYFQNSPLLTESPQTCPMWR